MYVRIRVHMLECVCMLQKQGQGSAHKQGQETSILIQEGYVVCLFSMKMLAGTIQLSIGAKKKLGIGIN